MSRRIIAVLCGLALVASIWFALGLCEDPQNANAVTAASLGDHALDRNQKPERAPHFQLPGSGRITVEHSELPESGEVILVLPIAADSIGDKPLPVRVVAVDGRVVDGVATQSAGNQPSVTVSLDPKWLKQGSYLIQLETKEKSALALRRYVLIIN